MYWDDEPPEPEPLQTLLVTLGVVLTAVWLGFVLGWYHL